jgi:hypothetical protein
MKGWKLVETANFVKAYENKKGEIRCVYPKAPRWAQDVSELIFRDIEINGMPTEKGVKDIVRGQWAKMISEAAK